jgi:hypothetical protein
MSSNISSTNFGLKYGQTNDNTSPIKSTSYVVDLKKQTTIANNRNAASAGAGGVNFRAKSYAEYIAYKKALLRNN